MADVLGSRRLGLGVVATTRQMFGVEARGRGRIARVRELVPVQTDRDGHDFDAMLAQECVGQVAGRVGHDTDAH